MNKCAKFHKDSPSGKKLNSISRERLNFRRRPILCTTLYRNLMHASNFGCTFDQLFVWVFSWNFHRRCLSTFSIPWCKKVKNDQKLKSKGGPALISQHWVSKQQSWAYCLVTSVRIHKHLNSLQFLTRLAHVQSKPFLNEKSEMEVLADKVDSHFLRALTAVKVSLCLPKYMYFRYESSTWFWSINLWQ